MFQLGPTKFSPNTQLITSGVIMALRGISAEAIAADVERGDLRFVWDVSPKGRRVMIQELRFWAREIVEPSAVSNFTLAQAVGDILGQHRTRWRGVELAQMLALSRPSIHRLHKRRSLPGEIKNGTLWVERSVLQKFLGERWLGNSPSQ